MKLGMTIRNWGPTATPEFLAECARIADRSTLDAIWFNDHLGFPPELPEGVPVPREMGDLRTGDSFLYPRSWAGPRGAGGIPASA